ncbi:hypothetical protein EP331_04130 [bacterium]|nr:MAG: hypothetical protein EP331_04130 [bacterium]
MKVGIVGDELVVKAWENRLQQHASVREVILVKKSEFLPQIPACIIVNPDESAYDEAAMAIRKGINCFLVSRLPTKRSQIERLYHFAEESGVHLQLAHWSSYAPASQWIQTKIPSPDYIQINRYLQLQQYNRYDNAFSNLWIDDLAYCLKIIKSNVHKVDIGISRIKPEKAPHIQLFIRFDNGGVAGISIQTTSSESSYKRTICDKHHTAEYNVLKQEVLFSSLDPQGNVFQEFKHFEEEEPADRALTLFLKCVQTRTQPEYSIFDSLKLTRIIQQIEEKLMMRI